MMTADKSLGRLAFWPVYDRSTGLLSRTTDARPDSSVKQPVNSIFLLQCCRLTELELFSLHQLINETCRYPALAGDLEQHTKSLGWLVEHKNFERKQENATKRNNLHYCFCYDCLHKSNGLEKD